MALCNTSTRYGAISRILHWLVAFLVIALLIVGATMGSIDNKATKSIVSNLHKLTGVAVLFLGVLFLVWTLLNKKPAHPEAMACWEKLLARSVQTILYCLIIFMPFTGWLMSSAAQKYPQLLGYKFIMPLVPHSKPLATAAKEAHEFLAWALLVLILLHVAGALKHHFIDKSDVLLNMLGRSKNENNR